MDAAGGGFGLEGGGDANPPNPESKALDETEALREAWGFAGGNVGEVRLSNRLPPPLLAEAAGEVTLGAAGVAFVLLKLVRLANGDGFSACFGGGGDVVDGKLRPLKASVKPPMLDDDVDCGGGGDAISPKSPKDGERSCWAGAC